jgi:hypothetical protein
MSTDYVAGVRLKDLDDETKSKHTSARDIFMLPVDKVYFSKKGEWNLVCTCSTFRISPMPRKNLAGGESGGSFFFFFFSFCFFFFPALSFLTPVDLGSDHLQGRRDD